MKRIGLLISLALGVLSQLVSPAMAAQPNVVLILADDQGWADYGFMGHPVIETPRLDRLASQSMTFTRGYVPDSLCRPSLATIATGLYPHQHGITGNDPALPDPNVNPMRGRADPKYRGYYETLMRRIETHPTLPRILGEAGYVSYQCGKWWEGNPRRGGFTEGLTHGDPTRGGRHGDAGLKIGREGMEPLFDFMDGALADEKPFFVWYAPFMPHAPHTPPEDILAKYEDKTPSPAVARYWAMCEWFDQTCGELLDYLDRHEIAEDTLVIYVCDNGWIQAPDRPNRFAPRSKRTPYEGGIRTPIMVHWPGQVEPQMDRETPVSSVDIAPTVLAACGLEVPANLPGINLLDRAALAEREAVFGDVYTHDVADVDNPTRSLTHRWVIEGWWKLIVPNPAVVPDDQIELYHLGDDPNETRNLAAENAELVQRLKAKLDAWWSGPAS